MSLKSKIKKLVKPALLIGAAFAAPALAAKIGTSYIAARAGVVQPGPSPGAEVVGEESGAAAAPAATIKPTSTAGIAGLLTSQNGSILIAVLVGVLLLVVMRPKQ